MPGVGLPIGSVTFSFTDIEGSTKLWEEHPAQMRGALARHNAIMREVTGGFGVSLRSCVCGALPFLAKSPLRA